jgi:hypothetical protein
MIRTSKSHFFKGASGTSKATPKLYSTAAQAEAWCKKFNDDLAKFGWHPDDGPYEVVPVDLVFGDSYIPQK